jgi:hypothetical protein
VLLGAAEAENGIEVEEVKADSKVNFKMAKETQKNFINSISTVI